VSSKKTKQKRGKSTGSTDAEKKESNKDYNPALEREKYAVLILCKKHG